MSYTKSKLGPNVLPQHLLESERVEFQSIPNCLNISKNYFTQVEPIYTYKHKNLNSKYGLNVLPSHYLPNSSTQVEPLYTYKLHNLQVKIWS